MLTRQENPRIPGEARVRYEDGDFTVLASGSFVSCAVTGARIPLEDLRYWSVARQEPYADANASFEAHARAGTYKPA